MALKTINDLYADNPVSPVPATARLEVQLSDDSSGASLVSDVQAAVLSGLAATSVSNTPAGGIAATNVQAAINELDTEKQPLDSDLTALAALATNGLLARTGSGTAATRTVTGTTNEIAVANGDGVAGNPTVALPATIALAGKTVTGLAASSVVNTPAGTIAATDVQAAINELDTEKAALTGAPFTGACSITTTGSAGFTLTGDTAAFVLASRFANSTASPIWFSQKSRGVIGAGVVVNTNDIIGQFLFQAYNGSAFGNVGSYNVLCIDTTPGVGATGGRHVFNTSPIGSSTVAEVMRLDSATGLSMFGANPVIDADRSIRLRVYTVATLPTPGTGGRMAYASNLRVFNGAGVQEGAGVGTGGSVGDNGTNWKIAGTNVTAIA